MLGLYVSTIYKMLLHQKNAKLVDEKKSSVLLSMCSVISSQKYWSNIYIFLNFEDRSIESWFF